jgi:hypothetical protein
MSSSRGILPHSGSSATASAMALFRHGHGGAFGERLQSRKQHHAGAGMPAGVIASVQALRHFGLLPWARPGGVRACPLPGRFSGLPTRRSHGAAAGAEQEALDPPALPRSAPC